MLFIDIFYLTLGNNPPSLESQDDYLQLVKALLNADVLQSCNTENN